MKRFRMPFSLPAIQTRLNCLAILIAVLASTILLLNFQAAPAGAGPEVSKSAIDASVPVPVADEPEAVSAPAESATAAGPTPQEIKRQVHSAIHASKVAMQLHIALLELGIHRIEKFADYTATFVKQERLDGEDLKDLQTMYVKLRHEPFSVYLKWMEGGDVGREVLFVQGQLDDKMLVHIGGLKGRLLPQLKLDPEGDLAMKESRYPVTQMGLRNLSEKLLTYRKRDLALKQGVRWELFPDQSFSSRPCHCFVVEWDSREIEPTYRKSVTYIDDELSLPVCVKNFGWNGVDDIEDKAKLDEATLIEFYGYTDLKFNQRLDNAHFDKTYSDYTFKR